MAPNSEFADSIDAFRRIVDTYNDRVKLLKMTIRFSKPARFALIKPCSDGMAFVAVCDCHHFLGSGVQRSVVLRD